MIFRCCAIRGEQGVRFNGRTRGFQLNAFYHRTIRTDNTTYYNLRTLFSFINLERTIVSDNRLGQLSLAYEATIYHATRFILSELRVHFKAHDIHRSLFSYRSHTMVLERCSRIHDEENLRLRQDDVLDTRLRSDALYTRLRRAC